MNTTNIMSIVAIILGLYIILSFFQVKDTPSPKNLQHICYDIGSDLTHSQKLKAQLLKNEYQQQEINFYDSPILSTQLIDKKQVQIVKIFDKFMNQFYQFQFKTKSSSLILQGIKQSQINFINCAKKLQHIFNSQQCLQDWNAYQVKCVKNLKQLKKLLDNKIQQRSNILKNIQNINNLSHTQNKNQFRPFDQQLKQYTEADQKLRNQLTSIELQIQHNSKNIADLQLQYNSILLKIQQLKKLKKQCQIDETKSSNCQKIITQMLKLGYESIQGFVKKIEKKKKSLGLMRDILNRDDGIHVTDDLKQMYHKSLDQLKQLLKIYAHYKIQMSKHCGCPQQIKQQYTTMLKIKIDQLNLKQNQIKQLQKINNKSLLRVNQIKLQRIKITNKLKQLINNQKSNTDKNNQKLNNFFIKIKQIDNQLNNNNKNYLNQLKFCQNLQIKLNQYMQKFSNINDCLVKKQYYQQLKKKHNTESSAYQKMNHQWTDALKKNIQEFKI